MKKLRILFANSIVILSMIACSNSEKKSPETPASPSPSELMKEEPPYDPSKIDPAAPVIKITLHAQGNSMTDMQYDQKEIKVNAGSTIKLEFINECTDAAMMHNFVLIVEGKIDDVAKEGLKAGVENNYIPKMKEILVSTKVLKPKSKTEITFPAPEKGEYEFVCTYPGHSIRMRGRFLVE